MHATSGADALWQRERSQFPAADNLIYLNHAGVAPLCARAAQAMRDVADDCLQWGSFHYEKWMDGYEAFRVAAATLIRAHRDEIAIVKNTSEGIATVALGMDWRPGDKIVVFKEEFPANYFPWRRLESKGVTLRWLSFLDPLDKIDEACRGARLLAISYVQYLSGYRANLRAIGEICQRHNTFFFVDAIQGLGVYPLDVEECHIDALAADGHKWLVGPEGCGLLYIRRRWLDAIEPVEFGWTNIAGFNDYACRDEALRPDAARYECGTLNTVGTFGLKAAMEYLLDVGVHNIAPAVTALADRIHQGVTAKGYEVLGERTSETASGIVTFRKPDIDSRLIVSNLKRAGFMPAPRQGLGALLSAFLPKDGRNGPSGGSTPIVLSA